MAKERFCPDKEVKLKPNVKPNLNPSTIDRTVCGLLISRIESIGLCFGAQGLPLPDSCLFCGPVDIWIRVQSRQR